MDRQILAGLRKSCITMALFAGSFVLVYSGVVALTKFVYIYFRGFIPEFNEQVLRAVFYALSAGAYLLSAWLRRRRYSPGSLKAHIADPDSMIRHLLLTAVIGMAMAEAVLICGFFLFFLSAMYVDYVILALLSSWMLFESVPKVSFLEEALSRARKG